LPSPNLTVRSFPMTSTVRSGYSCKDLKKFSDQRVKAQSVKSIQANITERTKKLQLIIYWTPELNVKLGEYKSHNFLQWIIMQRLEENFRSTSESTEYKVCPSKYCRNGKKKNLQWIILNTRTQCYTGEYKSYNFYSESYWRPELNVELWGILNTDDKFCSCAKY